MTTKSVKAKFIAIFRADVEGVKDHVISPPSESP
jgi:hypothetical protein